MPRSGEIRRAILDACTGADTESLVDRLIVEAGPKDKSSFGLLSLVPNTLRKIVPGAASAWSLWKIAKMAGDPRTPQASQYAARTLMGNALALGGEGLSHRIVGSTMNVLGGPQAMSGKGDKVRYSMTFNVPNPNLTTTTTSRRSSGKRGGGGEGGPSASTTTTTTMPDPNYNPSMHPGFASFEAEPESDGYAFNLYWSDPRTGDSIGAPVKTFNARFGGSTPANLQRIQQQMAQAITHLGVQAITGRAPRMPPGPIPRPPGRPPLRRAQWY